MKQGRVQEEYDRLLRYQYNSDNADCSQIIAVFTALIDRLEYLEERVKRLEEIT